MSMRTLPLLFLNLGGEMLYILDQRLRAQNIPVDKAQKVLNDIISTMFSRKFMEELFKPQELYSKKALRTVYDRLAHASIMRLNQASMDKLYDLMTMAFKYQVLLCPRPKDVLLVTFNHLDAIKEFIQDSPTIKHQVDETFRQLTETYGGLSAGEFQLIRQTLLIFFQDLHIRVKSCNSGCLLKVENYMEDMGRRESSYPLYMPFQTFWILYLCVCSIVTK
uniref:Organic solute carrier partner 1 n=1 Tax=Microcebus murinus TaxID=30608 RepID=A0A8C6EIZ7_MICMU